VLAASDALSETNARENLFAAAALVVVVVLSSCGTTKAQDAGPPSADTVGQLEALLHARADAMGRGDAKAFMQTIDTTKPAFRRMQQRMFDLPNDFISLKSSFKLSSAERYKGYVRAFVDQTLEGNAFFGAFTGTHQQSRLYFRLVEGRWVLTEPTGDETGEEKKRVSGDATTTYRAMDEDVAGLLAREVSQALVFATKQAPRPVSFKIDIAFVPTAELAGPGWDATIGLTYNRGTTDLVYGPWYGFDSTRSQGSPYTQYILCVAALIRMRDSVIAGIGARLSNDRWLDQGWLELQTGLDYTAVLRQSCAGIPVPTLRELAAGPPPLGPGVPTEVHGRHYAYSQAMVAYLFERFGPDAYWRLLEAYAQNGSAPGNFSAVLKTSQDEFYGAWLIWLKKKYC
jgi:hypothetical protein